MEKRNHFFDSCREDGAISLKDRYHELDVNVTHGAAGHAQYADDDHKKLVNLGPIGPYNNYRLTSSCGKEIKEIGNAIVLCKN